MKVLGTVKDAATEVPLPGAKIRLYVREEELAVLQSDSEGTFKHKSDSQYIGEILICKVEKAGYEPQKVIQEFEEDEVTLTIKLVPGKEEKIELTVNLKDEKRNPLKGINISLEVDGEGVGVGISDKDGIFKISLSPDLEGKTINYDAELAGFVLASGAVLLKKETSHKITMKKPPAPPSGRKWLKIAALVPGIALVILAFSFQSYELLVAGIALVLFAGIAIVILAVIILLRGRGQYLHLRVYMRRMLLYLTKMLQTLLRKH